MKLDSIKQYISLKESLVREQQELENRLREINAALGSVASEQAVAAKVPAAGGRRGRRSGLSLRTAVMQVLSERARTKEEILQAVAKLGYKFNTSNPMNSLGVILYGKNPKFHRENGVFSYGGPAPSAETGAKPARRKISPEGLARIAAAQRARWARAKSGRS